MYIYICSNVFCRLVVISKLPGCLPGKQPFASGYLPGIGVFLKIWFKCLVNGEGKHSGKWQNRLHGLEWTIYPKSGFRIPSVLLPDRHWYFFSKSGCLPSGVNHEKIRIRKSFRDAFRKPLGLLPFTFRDAVILTLSKS